MEEEAVAMATEPACCGEEGREGGDGHMSASPS